MVPCVTTLGLTQVQPTAITSVPSRKPYLVLLRLPALCLKVLQWGR